jgi:hypothetical protein
MQPNSIHSRRGVLTLTAKFELLIEAAAFHAQATEQVPKTSPLRSHYLSALNISAWQYSNLAPKHLAGALELLDKSLASLPDGPRSNPSLLLLKALLHYQNAQYLSDRSSAHLALDLCNECYRLSDRDSQEHFDCLMLMGDAYSYLIDHGETNLLVEWERWSAEAQAFARRPSDVANAQGNLGRFLQSSFLLTGDRAQLDFSIDSLRKAISHFQDSSSVAELNTSLGGSLHHRYDLYGDDADLSEALSAYAAAAADTNGNDSARARRFNNVGVTAREKYDRTGLTKYLLQAIAAHDAGISHSSDDPALNALSHHNLGFCLRQLYERDREEELLERAIVEHEHALQICPPDWNQRPTFLTNLGSSLLEKFKRDRDLAALSRAIEVRNEAYEAVPSTSPARVGFAHHLAAAISTYTTSTDDRIHASELFREACKLGLKLHVEEALLSAINWVRWSFLLSNWSEVIEAYDYFQSATDTLVRQQVLRSAKEGWLRDCQGVALRAAYAMSKLGRTADAAVELERDRARVSSEVMSRERVDLRILDASQPQLFRRFRQTVHSWTDIEREHNDADMEDAPKKAANLRHVRSEFDNVVTSIRGTPGFESFLMDTTFSEIAAAAADYPLVYIGVTELGGLGLLVENENVTAVWLDDLKDQEFRETLQTAWPDGCPGYLPAYTGWLEAPDGDASAAALWFASLDRTCEWLWHGVVERLLGSLGSEKRLTLIPLGFMNLLPIHAAWTIADGSPTGRHYALDQCEFRYGSNARALLAATKAVGGAATERLMAVLNPDGSLPGAQWETDLAETHFARRSFPCTHDVTRENPPSTLPQPSNSKPRHAIPPSASVLEFLLKSAAFSPVHVWVVSVRRS